MPISRALSSIVQTGSTEPNAGREVLRMPGFGRGGRGGFGRGGGFGGGFGRAYGVGRGMGNPYPYCRFYPWMPRRWWAMGLGPYSGAPNPQVASPDWGSYQSSPWVNPASQ